MIDSDLVFGNDHIKRILSHDEPVVGAVYTAKQEGPIKLVCNSMVPPGVCREDGLVNVRYVGSGFVCVARRVFEAMIARLGDDIEYVPDEQPGRKEWDFWGCGVYRYNDGSKRYLSEDWWFCQKAIDLGFKVWLDTRIILRHSGTALYPLSYQQEKLFESGQRA